MFSITRVSLYKSCSPLIATKRASKFIPHPKTTSFSIRYLSTGGNYVAPKPFNEQNVISRYTHFRPALGLTKNAPQFAYTKSSPEREDLVRALNELQTRLPIQVPTTGGSSNHAEQNQPSNSRVSVQMPSDHATTFAQYSPASSADVTASIEAALRAKSAWQDTPFTDRAAIFLRAADLVAKKYRNELLAATMLGQGKNAWQAEIDAAAELADFFRFNVAFAQQIYDDQPKLGADGHHGRTDWRPLEGFVYAVSPFNFTAIGGNLVSAPALMGNVVVWKPSPMSVYPSYLIHKILLEAGLPPDVIQLVNGDPNTVTDAVLAHREFSALNFIGSSDVFRSLYARTAQGVAERKYRDFPRLVSETSGKNFHLIHRSADIDNAVKHTIRSAFEYSGQKCSACSRLYVPESQAAAFFAALKQEMSQIKVGSPTDFSNFLGPVINRPAFDRIAKAIDAANEDAELELVFGGTHDDTTGLYITPTVYISRSPSHPLFSTELFGPVVTAYIYPDSHYDDVLSQIDSQGGGLALTGAIFATEASAIRKAEDRLRFAAGNLYINCKTTGAVIGQQSFGGARASGTCDKAGSANFLMRFTTPRTLKEEFNKLGSVLYPSNT